MPKSVEDDLEYQEVIARRMEAVKQDIPDFDNFPWAIYQKSYPGIPLKHLVDNLARFGVIEHDADCPELKHDCFFHELHKLCNNEIHSYAPQECPQFPKVWNQWHDELDVDKLRRMPLKTFYQVDSTNHVKNPQPL